MDLKTFLLNNASLQSLPRRRRHSIAVMHFLHALHDIPEKPEEEDTDKERRRSTGNFEQAETRQRAVSKLPCECTQEYYESTGNVESTSEANGTIAFPSDDCNVDESPSYKRLFSFEDSTKDNEHLTEAVSTYVLSYTDDAGDDACNTGDISPPTTGSFSPQESSKETNDEQLAQSKMLGKVDTSMAPHRSRRGNVIDPDVLERITSLTPVVESSRSSSASSVSVNLNGSPEDGDCNVGSELGSRRFSTENTDSEEGMLEKILVSPRLTRRGSLSDVLQSLSPQFDNTSDLGRHETHGSDGKLSSALLSLHANGHIRDPWRSLSPINCSKGKIERGESPNIQRQVKNDSQIKNESENALGKIMNFPNLLKRRGYLGDVLRTLSPQIGSPTSRVVDTKKSLKPAAEKELECNSPSKDKDGILGRILKSPALTRRGSIGNVLNTLSPNHATRTCPSPSPLTIKCDTDDAQPEVQSPQRKISAPLPSRSVAPPQRKSSVNVIKRSPITFVIPNNKSGRTEGSMNALDYYPSSGVGFNNSRFLPLSQEEADDYSRIKKTEASRLATTKSTITMSSRVTVHGGGGKGIVRKLGISLKQPPLNDSLPTEERFAALSERYASLKAKLEGSDSKQKTQDSSSKPSEKSGHSQNTDDELTQSKCWTTVESIQIQQFGDHQVSDKRIVSTESTLTAKDSGKQETDNEENGINFKQRTVTSSKYNHVSGKEVGVIETRSRTNTIKKSPNADANNYVKPSVVKMQIENDGVGSISSVADAGKTTLDFRLDSPAQRSRTSVLAKLMNRKMGPRRKQSIVPRVAKRRSKVYTEKISGSNGMPASAAQFEKIRSVVESSVLCAPVRQEVR